MKQKIHSHYRAGRYYCLRTDIDVIPRGVYFLNSIDGDTLEFRVGKKALFFIDGYEGNDIVPIRHSLGIMKRTLQRDFADRYQVLLIEKSKPAQSASDGSDAQCVSGPKDAASVTCVVARCLFTDPELHMDTLGMGWIGSSAGGVMLGEGIH